MPLRHQRRQAPLQGVPGRRQATLRTEGEHGAPRDAAPPPATTKSDDAVTPAAISEQLADFFASGGTCEIVGDQPGSGAIDHLAAIASNGDINAGDTTNDSGTFGTKPLPKIKSGPPGAAEPADARSRNRAAPGFFGRHWFELLVLVFATTGIVLLGALVLSTAPAVPGGRHQTCSSRPRRRTHPPGCRPQTQHGCAKRRRLARKSRSRYPRCPPSTRFTPPLRHTSDLQARAAGAGDWGAGGRGLDASAARTRGGMPQPPAPGGADASVADAARAGGRMPQPPAPGADASAARAGGRMPQPPAPGGDASAARSRSRRPTRRRPTTPAADGGAGAARHHQGWRGVLVARWRLAARRDGPRARGGEPRPTGALCLWPHHATANGVFLHRRRTLGSRWFCDASDARGAPRLRRARRAWRHRRSTT